MSTRSTNTPSVTGRLGGQPPAVRATVFRPADTASLRDYAYDALRDAIISGTLSPGDRIKERDVAQQMQVSTTPVKEALRRLEQAGLVVSYPRRGVVVSSLALTAVEEIVEIRAVLEALAARFVAARMPPGFRSALELQLALMLDLTQRRATEDLVVANTTFHELIREGSHNSFIVRFVSALEPFDRSVRRQALADPHEADRGYREHREIGNVIFAGDGNQAELLMRDHIMRTVRFVVTKSERRHRAPGSVRSVNQGRVLTPLEE